jgi:uncharacterized protein
MGEPVASDPHTPSVGKPPRCRRVFRRLVLEIGLILAVFLVVLAAIQRKLIYFPSKEVPSVERAALSYAGPIMPVSVPASDGLTLAGWLLPAESGSDTTSLAAAVADDRLLVIWFCGNGGHRAHRLMDLAAIHSLSAHALIVDYRGYAENAGSPSEAAIANDARDIWKFATQQLQKPASQIVICGESIGGGVSVRLASDLCKEGIRPGGLVLQSTFSALTDAAAYHYPWLPVRLLMIDRYPSIDRINDVKCPLLMVHGRRDQIVPFEQGRRLFDAAPAKSESGVAKRFVEFPEADHNDIMETSHEPWVQAFGRFLDDIRSAAVVAGSR